MSADNPQKPETPAPEAAQLPSCRPAVTNEPKPTWMNPLGVAAVLLVIIFTALIIHNENRSRSMLALLPLDTEQYLSHPSCAAIQKIEDGLGVWEKTPSGKQPERASFAEICAELKITSPEAVETLKANRWGRAAFRVKTADADKVRECVIFECGSAWDVKKIFADKGKKITIGGFHDAYELPGRYFAMLKPYAVFTDDKDALETVIACWQKKIPSLADEMGGSKFSYDKNYRLESFVRAANVSGRNNIRPVFLGGFDFQRQMPTDSALLTEKTVKNGKIFSQTSFIRVPRAVESAAQSCGFWSWLGWIVGIIAALVIGLPALFILTVLLLAGYFHIVSRIKGENVPTVAPALPPLSEELKADLKVNDKPAAPAQPETAPENNQEKTDGVTEN